MKQLVTKGIGLFLNSTAYLFPKWNAEYAFALLCRVKRTPISERGKKFLASASTTYLDLGQESAALHRWGTGPKKLLFLHGWMSNSQRWQPYVERLDKSEYSIYAIDAPGHGMAKGKQLNIEMYRQAVVKTLSKIGKIDTLVCHSLGGLVGSYAFLANPNIAIKKYVIMGAPSGMDAIFYYFQQLLGLSKKTLQNLSAKVNSVLKIKHQEIAMNNFFRKVKDPVLVIHDTGDIITPFQPIKKALEQNSHIKTMFTKELQHDLKSNEVYTRVIKFIQNEGVQIKRSHSA